MRVEPAEIGALVVDSLPFSLGGTAAQALALRAAGVRCLVGYLGAMNATRLGYLMAAGLAFMPVTFGMAPKYYSGSKTAADCKVLGLPPGCSVWLDLEGLPAFHEDPALLIANANSWAADVAAAGYMPCLLRGRPSTPHERRALGSSACPILARARRHQGSEQREGGAAVWLLHDAEVALADSRRRPRRRQHASGRWARAGAVVGGLGLGFCTRLAPDG